MLRLLRTEAAREVLATKSSGKADWYRTGENPDDADEQEVWRRFRLKVVADHLDQSPEFRLLELRRTLISEGRTMTQLDKEIADTLHGRYEDAARTAGLDTSTDYRFRNAEREVRSEIRSLRINPWISEIGNLKYDQHAYLDAVADHFAPFRRIDRFARAVAILQWLDEAKKLPEQLPKDVVPLRIQLPARMIPDRIAVHEAR